MAKKTLLLQPVQGKFVQVMMNSKTVKIWLVNPDTNEQGTEVAYEDGIKLLALPHPVVCVAQIKGKDGKFIQQLDEEDKALIEEKKRELLSGTESVGNSTSSASNSALEKLVETQTKLIESQNDQIKLMQNSLVEMKKQFEEFKASSAKTTKKGSEAKSE